MKISGALIFAVCAFAFVKYDGKKCEIYPESLTHYGQPVDDAPSIHEAFQKCGNGKKVIFSANHVFHVNSVLNTTNLRNCDVLLRGELRFSDDINYWRSHVFPVQFQNQSTAWLFGGENVTFKTEHGGWYNGQGQAWYTENRNGSNQPGRPISITFYNSKNLKVDGLRIVQPQFWAIFVWKSYNVFISNFYANATSNDEWSTVNTDGFDSWQSDLIRVENATIKSHDDCFAPKGNTTNLVVRNVTCHETNGMAIGSVGQYPDTPDYVQNVTFEDVKCINCRDGAYIKTWNGQPSNGDKSRGGGSGLIKNITFKNFEMINVGLPIQISQCIYTEDKGACNSSRMQIEDVRWVNIRGTSQYNIAASIYCSALHPCPNVAFDNVQIKSINETLGLPLYNTTLQESVFQCANIIDQQDSGIPCNHNAPSNYGQHPDHNVQPSVKSA